MKDYKLISSGANGKLYYAMYSALDKLKEFVEFADRVYIIDEGKNYIWTGSQFVEDLNPIDHSDDSESGGGSEPLMATVAISYDEDSGVTAYTCNKTRQEIHDAFPNVTVSTTTISDEDITYVYMGLLADVYKVTSPDNPDVYGIIVTLEIDNNTLTSDSSDGYPYAVSGIG